MFNKLSRDGEITTAHCLDMSWNGSLSSPHFWEFDINVLDEHRSVHIRMLLFLHICISRYILTGLHIWRSLLRSVFELKCPYSVKFLYTFIHSLTHLLSLQDFLFYIVREDTIKCIIHYASQMESEGCSGTVLYFISHYGEREPLLT